MKNTAEMSKEKKYRYIFEEQGFENCTRFKWLTDCLLGDIRTFLDGIQNHIDNKDKSPRGGGNLSIPILVNTALEFVSALYAGKTKYKDRGNYKATENAKKFVEDFFPGRSRQIPLLLWDGTRNGLVHTFSPKPFEYKGYYIHFQFVAEDRGTPSDVCIVPSATPTQISGEVSTQTFSSTKKGRIFSSSEQSNKTVLIKINVFELYKIFENAIEDYRAKLKNDEDLQDNFISAWKSIEEYTQNITDNKKSEEAEKLLSALKNNNGVPLFLDDFSS